MNCFLNKIRGMFGTAIATVLSYASSSSALAQVYQGSYNTPGRYSQPFTPPSGFSFGFGGGPRTFGDLVLLVVDYINLIIPVIIALTVLGFFIGVFKYGFSAGNEDQMKEAKKVMFWGVVGIFVMVSVWGIIRVLAHTFL